jgi:hypothetical protein
MPKTSRLQIHRFPTRTFKDPPTLYFLSRVIIPQNLFSKTSAAERHKHTVQLISLFYNENKRVKVIFLLFF